MTLVYLLVSLFNGPRASGNPWDSRSYEWYTPSPPPKHNFTQDPVFPIGPYDYTVPFRGFSGGEGNGDG
jgi:cytochrome c oxidase subunit 1